MKTQGLKRYASRSMSSSACLVVLLAVVCVGSWSRCAAENYDGIHALCATRCSVFVDPATYEMCMTECRNYVELALSRPRDPSQPQSVFEQLMEKAAAAAAGRNAAVTKATGDQSSATDRRDMRGAFVRIGRSQNDETPDAPVEGEDFNKRRSGFVRIGRRRATEEFVRIGKRSPDTAEAPAETSSEAEPTSAEMEKRKNPTAFVRIGKAKTSGNFVRIGRKQTAFVRIGKNAWNGVDELQDDERKAAGDNDEYERQLRRQAFVRIGK